jgi:photosystem II stability/assembly factor-like uncharacterized protein
MREDTMEFILYIGTDAGVITARSHDRQDWEIVEHGLRNWDVPEIAASPDSPNKIFAATRGDGVWLSEDFGKSWRKPCYGKRGPGKVKSLTIDLHNPCRLYAGCEPIDIFVSEDEGKNWERLDAVWNDPFIATIPYPVASVEPHVRDIIVDPADPNILYAALQIGFIIKSTDGGKSWKLLNKDLDCDVHTIIIDPTNRDRLIVTTGGESARAGRAPGRALYVSEDAGASWSPLAMNFTEEYAIPLIVDPLDPSRMYSAIANGQPGQWRRRDTGAESTLIRSRDGGRNWEKLNQAIGSRHYAEAMAPDKTVPGGIFAACRNGDLYGSDDGGDTWRKLPLELGISDLSSIALVHA